jgi:hypothetical protein
VVIARHWPVAKVACLRCNRTKCPLLTAFFLSLSLLMPLLFSQKELSF